MFRTTFHPFFFRYENPSPLLQEILYINTQINKQQQEGDMKIVLTEQICILLPQGKTHTSSSDISLFLCVDVCSVDLGREVSNIYLDIGKFYFPL